MAKAQQDDTHGVCPTCQQGDIRIRWAMMPDEDPGRFEDGDVWTPILYDHDAFGKYCEGSGSMAQFTYTPENKGA